MKAIDTRRYEMLVRVRDFGETHGDLFQETSLAREQFTAVAAVVNQLSGHAVTTMAAEREGLQRKAMARAALADQLQTISRTARGMSEDTPGLEDKFRLPVRGSIQTLLTAGRLFARDAEAFESQFIAHAMPPTFLGDLHAIVQAFERAIHDRVESKEDQIAARSNIAAALLSGASAVRKLDAILANQLRNDPATLAVWRHDRRVDYTRRGKRATGVPAPPPVTPASPPSAVPATPATEATS
jgi:hypothetical protein